MNAASPPHGLIIGAEPVLTETVVRRLVRHCLRYRDADNRRAAFQLVTALVPFLALVATMMWGVAHEVWLVLALGIPAGGFLVRLFVIQHDCGHNSFFTSRAANRIVGRLLSVLTFTPFGHWSRSHTMHHAGSGDLGRRGIGDIDTLTVREYRALSPSARLRYRFYRHPLILHLIGPPIYFLLLQRLPVGLALPGRQAWLSIMGLNLALVVVYGGLIAAFGVFTVLIALVPPALIASWSGGWLFFVQHQFEHTHWEESERWNLQFAALGGSSYYVLPPVLQWFTGNIGLHHIHHLNSRIPNYRLQECLDAEPLLATISRLSLRESLGCVGLSLWDEEQRRLVTFSHA